MPALTRYDEHERLWCDLLRQADELTHSTRWPNVPGCDLWAYEAADRVVGMVRRTPALLGMSFPQRRMIALRLHLRFSWATARSRAARFRGRLQPLDPLDESEPVGCLDSYAGLDITTETVARAFMAEGVPPVRSWALAIRIARNEPWDDVRACLISRGMRPPSANVLRTQCARDMGRHRHAVAERLGIEPHAAAVASRRHRGVTESVRREEEEIAAPNEDAPAHTHS